MFSKLISFNCVPTKGNLIFISILNAFGIAVNSYKVHRDKYKEIISKTIPSISI